MYRRENWTTKKLKLMLFNCGVEEDFWESLGLKGDKTNQPTENQSWIFIGRTYDETEAPILWPTDAKNWHFGRDPVARKDWRQVEKRIAEDEMVGWHHWLDGHEFEQALGVDDGQEAWRAAVHGTAKSQTSLSNWTDWVHYSPWGRKESDMIEGLTLSSL